MATTSTPSTNDTAATDEQIAQARLHFPENPFADDHHLEQQPASALNALPTPSSTAAATVSPDATGTSTLVIGDKNPFRHVAGQNTGTDPALTPSTALPSGSAVTGPLRDPFDIGQLERELPTSTAQTTAPASATAASSVQTTTSGDTSLPAYAPPPGPPPSSGAPHSAPATDSHSHDTKGGRTSEITQPASLASTSVASSSATAGPSSSSSGANATYAPPSGSPPSNEIIPDDQRHPSSSTTSATVAAGSLASSASQAPPRAYVPTREPVPGAPLLRKDKLLVYPLGLAECHKCHNMGYKFNDPTHPCKGCWSSYGKSISSILAKHGSLDRVPGQLQKPLPMQLGPPAGGGPSLIHRPSASSHRPTASAGYPGAPMSNVNNYRYMDANFDHGHGMHTPVLPSWARDPPPRRSDSAASRLQFRPPTQPPPPPTTSSQSVTTTLVSSPRAPIHRTDEALAADAQTGGNRGDPTGDEGVSAEGEVPPSYDEAVTAAAEGRTLDSQHVRPTGPQRNAVAPRINTGDVNTPPPPPRPSGANSAGLYSAPSSAPPPQHYGGPSGSPYSAGPQSPYGNRPGPGYGPHPSNPYGYGPPGPTAYGPNPNVHYVHPSRRPPPGALVVRPGDPRIGGRRCHNCGGDGSIEPNFLDALFGAPSEQCRVCNGSGRIFAPH
ncbi:hypothetical protein OC845_004372 [Tilletia horrida]|nr:hypothetical protein OC845_004372 [Tilletia horrida]